MSYTKEAKSTCQHGCKASLNIGENMMTKIRHCLSDFHDNPFFNLFPSDEEQNINSSMSYVELAGDFVQCVVRFYNLPGFLSLAVLRTGFILLRISVHA